MFFALVLLLAFFLLLKLKHQTIKMQEVVKHQSAGACLSTSNIPLISKIVGYYYFFL